MIEDHSTEAAVAADKCCANCGASADDDIKLTKCGFCDLVYYCSDKCKVDHRERHKDQCLFERAAKLHEKILFKQPVRSHLAETAKSVVCPCRSLRMAWV